MKNAIKNFCIMASLTPLWLVILGLGFPLIYVGIALVQAFFGDWSGLRDYGILCLMMAPVFGVIGAWALRED